MCLGNSPDACLEHRLMTGVGILRRRTCHLLCALNLWFHPSRASFSSFGCLTWLLSRWAFTSRLFHKRKACFYECQEITNCHAKPAGHCMHTRTRTNKGAGDYSSTLFSVLFCWSRFKGSPRKQQLVVPDPGARQFLLTVWTCCLGASLLVHTCVSYQWGKAEINNTKCETVNWCWQTSLTSCFCPLRSRNVRNDVCRQTPN